LKTLDETNVYVNVTYLKVNIENLGWDECLCECHISQRKHEKTWVRWKSMWMLHISKQILNTLSAINVYVNVSYLKANIENLGWDECLCKCYISQSKYGKVWVRWMFMWMLHISK
jgi:hypothetical protein